MLIYKHLRFLKLIILSNIQQKYIPEAISELKNQKILAGFS